MVDPLFQRSGAGTAGTRAAHRVRVEGGASQPAGGGGGGGGPAAAAGLPARSRDAGQAAGPAAVDSLLANACAFLLLFQCRQIIINIGISCIAAMYIYALNSHSLPMTLPPISISYPYSLSKWNTVPTNHPHHHKTQSIKTSPHMRVAAEKRRYRCSRSIHPSSSVPGLPLPPAPCAPVGLLFFHSRVPRRSHALEACRFEAVCFDTGQMTPLSRLQ